MKQRSQNFCVVFRKQGILQGSQGGPSTFRVSQAFWAASGRSEGGCPPHPPRAAHRPPARASRGALSQAGTLIKTGATPPSPVTPRYPHKLHFICFLFTVSLLIKSVIACLRGHGPHFQAQCDLRVWAHECVCVVTGLSSTPSPGVSHSVCVSVHVVMATCRDSPARSPLGP